MAKAPNEFRPAMFGSRIPIPGKLRFLSNTTPQTGNRNNAYSNSDNKQDSSTPTKVLISPSVLQVDSLVDEKALKRAVDAEYMESSSRFILAEAVPDKSGSLPGPADLGKRVCIGHIQYGELQFVGSVQFADGLWCGVELDKSIGKHDGCVQGVRYFTCRPGCGIMVPAENVVVYDNKPSSLKQTLVCDSTINVISGKEDISGPISLIGIEGPLHAVQGLPEHINPGAAATGSEPAPHQADGSSQRRRRDEADHSASDDVSTGAAPHPGLGAARSRTGTAPSPSTTPALSPRTEFPEHTAPAPAPAPKERAKCTGAVLQDDPRKPHCAKNTDSSSYSLEGPAGIVKQNSFELDDSLGILTPDQMMEFSTFIENYKTPSSEDLKSLLSSKRSDKTISNSRTPSSENLGSLPVDGLRLCADLEPEVEAEPPAQALAQRPAAIQLKDPIEVSQRVGRLNVNVHGELCSPSVLENSIIEFSLGLIDEDILASANQFSSNLDTTTNLDLPLDSLHVDGRTDFKSLCRSDQTPSPEDLPLDPIDSSKLDAACTHPSSDEAKSEASKSAANAKSSSFITSVTSITSLDTGYQGDGEMSRPASRGADHSPVAHKPGEPALAGYQWQKAVGRRQDPMTDSDFFTESDADIHDDHAPKGGDRHAQVIDGTLYGAGAQPAAPPAEVYIAHHEEMDSSGIFTDFDTNLRADDFSDGERAHMDAANDEKSPSDVSSKTISEDSQEIKLPKHTAASSLAIDVAAAAFLDDSFRDSPENPKSPTLSVLSNASSKQNCRGRPPLPSDETPHKKFKMPKKNVAAKVKGAAEPKKTDKTEAEDGKRSVKKTTNKWDAVMNKISKGQEENKTKLRLKEVKSKVYSGISDSSAASKRFEKKTLSEDAVTKSKIRRIRARPESLLPGNKAGGRNISSIHSSLSDVSVGLPPNKQPISHMTSSRVAKKRESVRCATPMTEVTAATGNRPAARVVGVPKTTAPRDQQQRPPQATREIKKNEPTLLPSEKAPIGRRTPSRWTPSALHKTVSNKDQSRVTSTSPHKGGSPSRNQTLPQRAPPSTNLLLPHLKHSAKGVEALGVLVQYLVFNLDAFQTPTLKRDLEIIKSQWIKDKLELEEIRVGYKRLEDSLAHQIEETKSFDNDRKRYVNEVIDIFNKSQDVVGSICDEYEQEKLELKRIFIEKQAEFESRLDAEISSKENEISLRINAVSSDYKLRIQELEKQNEHLKHEHRTTVEILREENESIREQLDEKVSLIQDLEELRYHNEKLKEQFRDKEKYFEDKLITTQDEVALLKEENKKILETFKSDTKDNKLQNGNPDRNCVSPQAALGRCTQLQDEVESLRTVLDLKLAELSDLRRAHGELVQAAEELPQALVRIQSLQARVEDLELQIERKSEIENQLAKENKKLLESYYQEQKQKKRLSLHNEELQWKLKQNSEVVNAILGQTPVHKSFHNSNQSLCDEISYRTPSGGVLNRSLHTSSFNEKHHSTPHVLERTLSFRERTNTYLKETLDKHSEFVNDRSNSKSADYFELDESPPSSPKVKGIVEKSDSVSWVLDMDESPEVLASRMVRRAGSFRTATPCKSTPTKSPATKRPRTKSNNSLALSSSASAIIGNDSKSDNRYRSKSVSLRDSKSPENIHPGEYLSNSWHYSMRNSPPAKTDLATIRGGVKLENNPDLEHDSDAAISLPALPSEISRKPDADKTDNLPSLPSGDLLLLQASFPKSSAGEALISESNSEDECSSSTSERSPSFSDTETSEEPTGSGNKCGEKYTKLQYDLYLMTESTTNSEVLDYSWSEEMDA